MADIKKVLQTLIDKTVKVQLPKPEAAEAMKKLQEAAKAAAKTPKG